MHFPSAAEKTDMWDQLNMPSLTLHLPYCQSSLGQDGEEGHICALCVSEIREQHRAPSQSVKQVWFPLLWQQKSLAPDTKAMLQSSWNMGPNLSLRTVAKWNSSKTEISDMLEGQCSSNSSTEKTRMKWTTVFDGRTYLKYDWLYFFYFSVFGNWVRNSTPSSVTVLTKKSHCINSTHSWHSGTTYRVFITEMVTGCILMLLLFNNSTVPRSALAYPKSCEFSHLLWLMYLK